jgi:hypothetical protein
MRLRNLFAVTLLRTVTAWPSASDAQSVPTSFVVFSDFIASVSNASAQGFLGQPGMGVISEAAFEEMRSHVLKMYQQVQVTHSFLLGAQYFDCIPIEQQPSLRLLGLNALAVPPPSPPAVGGMSNTPSPLELGLSDPFGNKIQCAAGTIPMRRITLEEIARRKTLSAPPV